jgi:iron complex transport system permease protein
VKATLQLVILGLLLVTACVLSLFYGGSQPLGDDAASRFILHEIRIPKTLTALGAGASLAACGLVLQILFRNPLAGPYVLGISSGASLMVAAVMLSAPAIASVTTLTGRSLTIVAATLGSTLVTLLVLAVARRITSNVVLLIMGLLFSQACGAIEASLVYFADPGKLKSFVVWGMGSLSGTTAADIPIYLSIVAVLLVSLIFLMKPLNALLLGPDYAQGSGIPVKRSRFALILITSALTGVTTAFCGPVAFVGIAVPVLSRLIFKTARQEIHFISCLLLGSTLLLFADAVGHSVSRDAPLPINIITTCIGAPLVIWLMLRNRSW